MMSSASSLEDRKHAEVTVIGIWQRCAWEITHFVAICDYHGILIFNKIFYHVQNHASEKEKKIDALALLCSARSQNVAQFSLV